MPRKSVSRPFAEARTFAHKLNLKTRDAWGTYAKSGNKPEDIPAAPDRIFRSEWQGWGDWLGTGRIANQDRLFRPYTDARAFVHKLDLKTRDAWGTYAKSGRKPQDIPASPNKAYDSNEWCGWGDWLGTGTISSRNHEYRPFSDARDFARGLELKTKDAWFTYAKSGRKPQDIPASPDRAYDSSEWVDWGDWLGTARIANQNREFRPFIEARAFVRALGLNDREDWGIYARSGDKPTDIPTKPSRPYGSEWRGWGDWLGTGAIAHQDKKFRPFSEARAFVRALGLKDKGAWVTYARSGQKPTDITSHPDRTYRDEWRGWADWLGVVNRWNRVTLLAFLQDLRPHLPNLDERELYEVLQQGGRLSAFRAALHGAPPLAVIRDLNDSGGHEIEQALRQATEEEIHVDASSTEASDLIVEVDPTASAGLSGSVALEDESGGDTLPSLGALAQGLRNIDALAALHYGLDDEAAEFLVAYRVGVLWQRYIEDPTAVREMLNDGANHGRWFTKLKTRFLAEADGAEQLQIPRGWSFTVQGVPRPPNLMQKRVAWAVRERGRVGNWSGVGSGKTLSAILASRVVDARATLIVTNNATAQQWEEQILLAYPDSVVHREVARNLRLNRQRHNFVVLNYEKFQVTSGASLIRHLLALDLDFVVLDEVQFVKQRDERASTRRKALEALVTHAAERNPDLHVLGMSATPVINNLLEARKLLEITVGTDFSDLNTQPTITNALAIHQKLMLHGFRWLPLYEQEMHVQEVSVVRNDLLESLRLLGRQVLPIEQLLLQAKLEKVAPYVQRGTLVYIHFVEGILPRVRQFIEQRGFRVGLYTGADKSGLSPFLKGEVDVLVASSPVGTGLDGLQKVCNRLVMLCLPWTNAEYEQIIGRIRRQGGAFDEVEIIVPEVLLDNEGDTWSWDQRRLALIHYKKTLSDCALDGVIPETARISHDALLQQSRVALESWIARVVEHGVLVIDRERLTIPLPPDLRQVAVRAHGEFGDLNRRWNGSRSATTHTRLQLDPSEWFLYHTLYREARLSWPETPAQHIAERIRARPEWVVGDFGCGECLLKQALPEHRVIGIDHVAFNADVIACDMAATPLADQSLDCGVFSLSLMGANWEDYLQEAHRALKPYGYLFVVEPFGKWQDRIRELCTAIETAEFQVVGTPEQRYDFLYLTALRV